MNDDIDRTIQRTKRYWYIDGLPEIAIGGIFLLLALYFWLQAVLPPESIFANLLTASLVLIIVGYSFISGKIVTYVKERLTYPRTGYVSYPRTKTKKRLLSAIFGALIGILLTVLIATSPASLFLIPTLTGVVIGLAMLYIGSKIGLLRYYLMAALSALIGIGLALIGMDTTQSGVIYYLSMGVALVAAGSATLWIYLQQTEPETEES